MKLFFIGVLLAIAVTSSAFASGETKQSVILPGNFNFKFKKTSDFGWTKTLGFSNVSYIINNKKGAVFYNLDGDLIGIALNITFDALPANLKEAFTKNYQGFTVKEVIRFDDTAEAAYFISAVDEKGAAYLKVDDKCNLLLFKPTKK